MWTNTNQDDYSAALPEFGSSSPDVVGVTPQVRFCSLHDSRTLVLFLLVARIICFRLGAACMLERFDTKCQTLDFGLSARSFLSSGV